MIYLKYLLYILRHKYYVLIECYLMGIVWRGITHDLSKFCLSEFFSYAKEYYKNIDSSCKYENLKILLIEYNYNNALEHHYNNNDHHWEYWIKFEYWLPDGFGFIMSYDALKEMVADWNAMSRTIGGSSIEYYEKNKKTINLNSRTQLELEKLLIKYGQKYYKV